MKKGILDPAEFASQPSPNCTSPKSPSNNVALKKVSFFVISSHRVIKMMCDLALVFHSSWRRESSGVKAGRRIPSQYTVLWGL